MNRGYACIGLYHPTSPINVGSVMRAAFAFDAAFVAIAGTRVRSGPTDTPKAWRHLPLIFTDDLYAAIPYNCVPVAVELVDNARPLHEYAHPERAFYIFGPENGTLGKAVLDWCRDVVYIPTAPAKTSYLRLCCQPLADCAAAERRQVDSGQIRAEHGRSAVGGNGQWRHNRKRVANGQCGRAVLSRRPHARSMGRIKEAQP